jgi:rhamnosyltransferase
LRINQREVSVESPRISVLLAAYNGSSYIIEQLDSIINQSAKNIDIFVSVDLCSDDTLSIITEYSKHHQNIYVLPYGERYGSAGQNFFRLLCEVDFSSYDYVAFADQDDIWYDFKLKRAYEQIRETGCDGYSSNVTAFWADGRTSLVKKDYPQTRFDYIFESPGPGCTFLMTQRLANEIKKSLLNKSEQIKSLWLHDWYCYAFARVHDYGWFIDTVPTMSYRQHDGNEVGANSGLKSMINRMKSVLSGDGLLKVVEQAGFLGIMDSEPLRLLVSNSRYSLFKLAIGCFHYRRKASHKLFFFLIFIWFSLKGSAYLEKR